MWKKLIVSFLDQNLNHFLTFKERTFMTKHAKHLVSVLSQCGYRCANAMAKECFGSNWRKCQNFQAVEFGTFIFLFATVNNVPTVSFLPTGKKPVVTEKQFEAMVAVLKQDPLPNFIYHGKAVKEEYCEGHEYTVFLKKDKCIHIPDENYRLNFADFLVSEGFLQKKWLRRHKKFLIADSQSLKCPAMWFSATGRDLKIHQFHLNGVLDSVYLKGLDWDHIDKQDLNYLFNDFSRAARGAKFIYFPYSQKMEPRECWPLGEALQFMLLVREVAAHEHKNTNLETVVVDTLNVVNPL